MDCKRCHKKMIPYLEESLKDTELLEMQQHLEECASCRGFAVYLKSTLFSIGNSRITVSDPFFYTRIKAKIDKQAGSFLPKAEFAGIFQPVLLSLLLMAAIFTGIKIGNSDWLPKTNSYVTENLDPILNELGSEPLESFLMN